MLLLSLFTAASVAQKQTCHQFDHDGRKCDNIGGCVWGNGKCYACTDFPSVGCPPDKCALDADNNCVVKETTRTTTLPPLVCQDDDDEYNARQKVSGGCHHAKTFTGDSDVPPCGTSYWARLYCPITCKNPSCKKCVDNDNAINNKFGMDLGCNFVNSSGRSDINPLCDDDDVKKLCPSFCGDAWCLAIPTLLSVDNGVGNNEACSADGDCKDGSKPICKAGKCEANTCLCANGTPATDAACTSNNANICAACSPGYTAYGNSCTAICGGHVCGADFVSNEDHKFWRCHDDGDRGCTDELCCDISCPSVKCPACDNKDTSICAAHGKHGYCYSGSCRNDLEPMYNIHDGGSDFEYWYALCPQSTLGNTCTGCDVATHCQASDGSGICSHVKCIIDCNRWGDSDDHCSSCFSVKPCLLGSMTGECNADQKCVVANSGSTTTTASPPADSGSTTTTASPPADSGSTTTTASPPADSGSTTTTASPPADSGSTTTTASPPAVSTSTMSSTTTTVSPPAGDNGDGNNDGSAEGEVGKSGTVEEKSDAVSTSTMSSTTTTVSPPAVASTTTAATTSTTSTTTATATETATATATATTTMIPSDNGDGINVGIPEGEVGETKNVVGTAVDDDVDTGEKKSDAGDQAVLSAFNCVHLNATCDWRISSKSSIEPAVTKQFPKSINKYYLCATFDPIACYFVNQGQRLSIYNNKTAAAASTTSGARDIGADPRIKVDELVSLPKSCIKGFQVDAIIYGENPVQLACTTPSAAARSSGRRLQHEEVMVEFKASPGNIKISLTPPSAAASQDKEDTGLAQGIYMWLIIAGALLALALLCLLCGCYWRNNQRKDEDQEAPFEEDDLYGPSGAAGRTATHRGRVGAGLDDDRVALE